MRSRIAVWTCVARANDMKLKNWPAPGMRSSISYKVFHREIVFQEDCKAGDADRRIYKIAGLRKSVSDWDWCRQGLVGACYSVCFQNVATSQTQFSSLIPKQSELFYLLHDLRFLLSHPSRERFLFSIPAPERLPLNCIHSLPESDSWSSFVPGWFLMAESPAFEAQEIWLIFLVFRP